MNSLRGQPPLGAGSGAATATVAALDIKTEFELKAELDLEDEIDLETSDELVLEEAARPPFDVAHPSSYLDAKPPHLTKSRRIRALSRRRRSRRARGSRRWLAVLMLALLVVAGLALTSVIVRLVRVGHSWASGQAAAASPLVAPPPELAGGLLRIDTPVHNAMTRQLIAEFTRRFTTAAGSNAGDPAAFYRELGTVDLATNLPGWVMYLGHNSAVSLGAPGVTINRVMTVLTRASAPGSFWRVAPGSRGGSAGCALTLLGRTPVSVCAWATEHMVGALMSPLADTRGNELAALMPRMRLDLQPGWPSRRVRV